MKHLARLLSLILLVGAGFFLSNCGGDGGGDEQSEQEIQFNKLKGVWTVQSVDVSPASATDWDAEFDGGQLTLISENFEEDGSYGYEFAVTGGVATSPWPGEGSWEFSSSNPSNNIVRLDSEIDGSFDNLPMTYELSNSDKTLEINFDLPDGVSFALAGRVASVEGSWTFVFTKP